MAEKFEFSSYNETMKEVLKPLNPILLDEYEGHDIRGLRNIDTPMAKGYIKAFKADKIEKIGFSHVEFMGGKFLASACVITPSSDYALPIYMSDWDEGQKAIHIITDLLPSTDCGRDNEYLAKYLDPIAPLWEKYRVMPGLEPIKLSWFRAMQSPYIITGRPPQEPEKIRKMTLDAQVDYLRYWISLWEKDEPRDPEYMKPLLERRAVMRDFLRHRDPGEGPLSKALGHDNAVVFLKLVMP